MYVYPSHFGHGQWVWHNVLLRSRLCAACYICRALEPEPEPERKADESFTDKWCKAVAVILRNCQVP